jgi:hypothetical protein
MDIEMPRGQLTRRKFLILGGTVAAGAAVVGPGALAPRKAAAGVPLEPVIIYRRSLRGRRGSKAAKLLAANMRFATAEAAAAHLAHPGDNARVVPIVVSADEFDRLFTSANTDVADIRQLGGPAIVGDCNKDGKVLIDELIRGVRIALGSAPVDECPPFDRIRDNQVKIDELIRGVNNALKG